MDATQQTKVLVIGDLDEQATLEAAAAIGRCARGIQLDRDAERRPH